jgi:nucleotide-binding universal stress UspA family protein
MAIKTVLVVMSGVQGDAARLKAGLALAARAEATVAVLHVKPSPILYAGGGGMEMPVSLIEAQVQEIDRRALSVEADVKDLAERAGTAVEWRCEEGEEVTVAGIHARYADLVVASPDLARDLVFDSASPVLAFPDEAKPDAPRRVLVAWNGSREAACAVRDALPLLKAAETVDVIVVDPPAGRPIGVDLGRFLGRHGIKVEVRERLSDGAAIGTLLLEEARTSGAELLVMGAYGHSRLREWVLGGATEETLDAPSIPVLLSH